MTLNTERKLDMLRKMLTIRLFEERVAELFQRGELPGFYHLYIGQEAIAVGACAALREDDYITSTHRGHGHLIAKGGRLDKMMAELYAKDAGYNRGKGGSMHLAAMELGMLGANGIVGGGIPIATGAALSAKMRKSGQVCVCFFGDGGSNQGTFHESINLAAALALPCIYVCENNLYAVGTRITQTTGNANLADRAVGYGIPGHSIDGNDVLAVYETVARARDRATAGEGPTLIECRTYRWKTHFEGEPDTYRDPQEVKDWIAREPIQPFAQKLMREEILTPAQWEAIQNEVQEELTQAVDFARRSPAPAAAEALTNVYAR